MTIDFEWDDKKAASNLRKHGVPFDEAVAVFLDPYRLERYDNSEEHEEDRLITLGLTDAGVLVIVYTDRSDAIRIISARKANSHEQKIYWQNR